MSSGLSWHEIQVLGAIESDLRSDRALERALRTMQAPPRRLVVVSRVARFGGQIPAVSATVMVGFAAVLTVLVARNGAVGGLAFLGAVWTATALALAAKITARLAGLAPRGRGRRTPR